MGKKLIVAFLGTGNYREVDYLLDDQSYTTPFTQVALARHYQDYGLWVFLTKKACEVNGQKLKEKLPSHTSVEFFTVPEGKSEEEHWEIFNLLVEKIPSGAELVVDVSHGFRSQPLLALAALRFLEVVKAVQIRRLLYGALLEDESRGQFIDLTPFLELLNWTQAAWDLMRYGWGKPLADLFTQVQDEGWRRTLEASEKGGQKVTKLKPLGETLKNLSVALELIRAEEAVRLAGELVQKADAALKEVRGLPQEQPIALLLRQIRDKYAALHVQEPFSLEGLRAQVEMLKILLETGSLAQALALMRELLVTKVCLDNGLDPLMGREVAEAFLNLYAKLSRQPNGSKEPSGQLGQLWRNVADVRNDVAHAGMRPNAMPGPTIQKKVEELRRELERLLALG